ncbi:hypothetical protein CHS0354_036606 [Potamilus streckersoni]|uniref:Uncharacterized protein n=1 Tax=Potamilus streckersoni TaxID=2493646 RepID=A0AAE0TGS0_9BIVA|nr:hypothetical protein CHS0354_036606 [Potamilus streckersoni]
MLPQKDILAQQDWCRQQTIVEEFRKCKERMSNRMDIIRTRVRVIEVLMEDFLHDVAVPVEVIQLLGQARSILYKIDINTMPVSEASQVYTGHRCLCPTYQNRRPKEIFRHGAQTVDNK